MIDPHLQLLPKTNVRYAMYANVQAEQILRKGRAFNLFLRFVTNQEEVDRLVEGISVVALQVIKATTLAMHNLQSQENTHR